MSAAHLVCYAYLKVARPSIALTLSCAIIIFNIECDYGGLCN